MTDVASLPRKWRTEAATARKVAETPKSTESGITLCVIAENMEQLANELESALAARSPAPSAPVGWRDRLEALSKQYSFTSGVGAGIDRAIRELDAMIPAAPSVSPAVAWHAFRDDVALIEAVLKGYPDSIAKSDGLAAIRRLASSAPQGEQPGGEVEPHCIGHDQFDYDCIDCSDALERKRKGFAAGDGTYTTPPPAPAAEQPQGEMVLVPRDPTEAMLTAGHRKIDWCRDDQNTNTNNHPSQTEHGGTSCKTDLSDAYHAMLSAAPSRPVVDEAVRKELGGLVRELRSGRLTVSARVTADAIEGAVDAALGQQGDGNGN